MEPGQKKAANQLQQRTNICRVSREKTMSNMKFLYVGTLYEGETCYDRMCAMRDIGLNVLPFDTSSYIEAGTRITRSLRHRLKMGINVRKLNQDLLETAAKQNGITHIWFDKATLIWPTTLKKLKEITSAFLIHYTPDPQIMLHRSRHYIKSIPLYDMIFTTKAFEVGLHGDLGARSVHLTHQSYDKNRFCPRQLTKEDILKYKTDVAFVGHYERYRAKCIKAIVDMGSGVKIWGGYWSRYAYRHLWAKKIIMGNGVLGEEYCKALSSASICLGFLSKLIPETTTTRSFEIPASGSFMLAERTKEHMQLFEEGKEAEFFSSIEELVEKVRYYLDNPQKRKEIADAGRQRCLKSGYSYQDRLKEILEKIEGIRN